MIDVRTSLEFSTGHIPGAANYPLDSIKSDLKGVAHSNTIVVVCQGGMRSLTVCERIAPSYPSLYNLVGGTNAWAAEGFVLEQNLNSAIEP